jgi:acetyl esterase/lipase
MSVDQARELLPPMIVQTAEFDMLNIDTEAFVPILREAGVLADYVRTQPL